MLWVNQNNISQKRTCHPLYEQHQITALPATLDPTWAKTIDILPGMVATKLAGDMVTLSDGSAAMKSFGLFVHFVAPSAAFEIDETVNSNGALAVYRGGPDGIIEITAPAFDTSKSWTEPTDGSEILLVPGAGTLNRGKLCPAVAVDDATVGYEVKALADPVAKLYKLVDAETIQVSLFL